MCRRRRRHQKRRFHSRKEKSKNKNVLHALRNAMEINRNRRRTAIQDHSKDCTRTCSLWTKLGLALIIVAFPVPQRFNCMPFFPPETRENKKNFGMCWWVSCKLFACETVDVTDMLFGSMEKVSEACQRESRKKRSLCWVESTVLFSNRQRWRHTHTPTTNFYQL